MCTYPVKTLMLTLKCEAIGGIWEDERRDLTYVSKGPPGSYVENGLMHAGWKQGDQFIHILCKSIVIGEGWWWLGKSDSNGSRISDHILELFYDRSDMISWWIRDGQWQKDESKVFQHEQPKEWSFQKLRKRKLCEGQILEGKDGEFCFRYSKLDYLLEISKGRCWVDGCIKKSRVQWELFRMEICWMW